MEKANDEKIKRPRVAFADAEPTMAEERTTTTDSGSAMPQLPNASSNIAHLSHCCPGFIGAGARMLIEPRSYRTHLNYEWQITIPIFQRPYCWPETQLRRWWRDATDMELERHHTGKATFKLVGQDGSGEAATDGMSLPTSAQRLLCIDGQQRTTSALLVFAALRDEALQQLWKLHSAPATADAEETVAAAQRLVDELDALLFLDVDAMREWARDWAAGALRRQTGPEASIGSASDGGEATMEGVDEDEEAAAKVLAQWRDTHAIGAQLPFHGGSRLLPSYLDRAPFFEAITAGVCAHALWRSGVGDGAAAAAAAALLSSSAVPTEESAQGLAKRFFDEGARQLACGCDNGDVAAVTAALARLRGTMEHVLDGFYFVYCEVLTPVDMPQVFLRLQDKSLFGFGALLRNDNPGVAFSHADLARNLLLAPVVMRQNSDTAVQDAAYEKLWVAPLALPAARLPGGLDGLVADFVTEWCESSPLPRHVGSLERKLEGMVASLPPALSGMREAASEHSPMGIYARLHSRVEAERRTLEEAAAAEGTYGELGFHDRALEVVLQALCSFAAALVAAEEESKTTERHTPVATQ